MHIEHSAVISLSPAAARQDLCDPSVLGKILPACVGISAGAVPWVASFDAEFMGLHERFDVEVYLREDEVEPALHLRFSTSTRMGRAAGEGTLDFEPVSSGTRLAMVGQVKVAGLLASLGEGLLRRAASEIITRTLQRLEESRTAIGDEPEA